MRIFWYTLLAFGGFFGVLAILIIIGANRNRR